MIPILSIILLLSALAGFLIGLINAFRRYQNRSVKSGWIVIPVLSAVLILIINLSIDHSKWNIENVISKLSSQNLDSLAVKDSSLSELTEKIKTGRKTARKLNRSRKESQPTNDIVTAEKPEPEQTNPIIAARSITSEQENRFVAFLRDAPKGNFRIKYIKGDREAFEYSKRISNLLIKAGYNLAGEITDFAGNEAVQGISLIINRNETEPRYARSIFSAFRSIGIDITPERNKQLVRPLEILISVGHRK